ncbi:MAG: sulfite exporter TauE/SafE family protein [Gammaproteobacteria bacterium]|nr:sulfite exporter TauE/SafE family protein [Gammaproteobacteria bacterium]
MPGGLRMNAELTLIMAFATGLFGAGHCLGMCGGLAGGYFLQRGQPATLLTQLGYHASRLAVYSFLGLGGAWAGRVLAQSGLVGKGQGLMMMAAGLLILGLGLRLALDGRPRERPAPAQSRAVRLEQRVVSRRPWAPLLMGTLNGLVPCSLVFSVAIKAATLADPGRAALFMFVFGLGTLPMMVAVTWAGAASGARISGHFARLAGGLVVLMGLWTLYEGYLFFDIMRGLANG